MKQALTPRELLIAGGALLVVCVLIVGGIFFMRRAGDERELERMNNQMALEAGYTPGGLDARGVPIEESDSHD